MGITEYEKILVPFAHGDKQSTLLWVRGLPNLSYFLSPVSFETFLPKNFLDTLAGKHVVFHIDSERVFV